MSLLLKAIEQVTPEHINRLMAAVLAVENMDAQEGDAAQAKFESLIIAAKTAGFTRPVDVAGFAMANAVVEAQNSRWIPVSERLPETFKNVLVLSKGAISINKHVTGYRHGGIWAGGDRDEDITHWMLLPATPDEVQP